MSASSDIDRIIAPDNPHTMASEIIPRLWSKKMREKFNQGGGKGAVLINNVRVVSNGSASKVEKMLKLNTPVNVRNTRLCNMETEKS